jgi:hypothetical protein
VVELGFGVGGRPSPAIEEVRGWRRCLDRGQGQLVVKEEEGHSGWRRWRATSGRKRSSTRQEEEERWERSCAPSILQPVAR